MSGAAVKAQHNTIEPAVPGAGSAVRHDADHSASRGDNGSPVHHMQTRLEEAVFASFSAKEVASAPRTYRGRAMILIGGAVLGGWALLMGGVALKIL